MKKYIRKLIREEVAKLFEYSAEEIKNQKTTNSADIERITKELETAKKELEVAKTNRTNTEKTKINIKDIDPKVEMIKKNLANKELIKYKNQEKEKKELIKSLEQELSDLKKKQSEINTMRPSEETNTETTDNTPMTPESPSTPSAL